MACAPSEDSDQPGHLPSLIRVFAVRMKKALVSSYPLSSQRRLLIRLGGCPGWAESSLGAQSFCLFCHQADHFRLVPIPHQGGETKLRSSISKTISPVQLNDIQHIMLDTHQNYTWKSFLVEFRFEEICYSWHVDVSDWFNRNTVVKLCKSISIHKYLGKEYKNQFSSYMLYFQHDDVIRIRNEK